MTTMQQASVAPALPRARPLAPAATIPTIGVTDLFAPLPERTWIVPRLAIAGGGRPTLIVGPPAAGKTILAQALALACAAGASWCGEHDCARARVLWLDAEVGAWTWRSRIQRLARAAGVTEDDLADRLRVAIHPAFALDAPDAEKILTATCRGFGLVVIDSLSALSGAAEEHTPEIGRLMLMLGRVSSATDAAIVVLHHTRRDGELRGSTSIVAGAECAWHIVDADGAGGTLRHTRSPMGALLEDVVYRIVDVAIDGDPRGGLALELVGHGRADAEYSSLDEELVGALRAGPLSIGALSLGVSRRTSDVRAAVDRLVASRRVERVGAGPKSRIRLLPGVSR